MANEANEQTCPGEQEVQEANECCENIVPACMSDTSKLNTETCSATPTSNSNGNGKSKISGLQSALTPILKCRYLNFGNKCTPPRPLFSLNNGTVVSNTSVSGLAISLSAASEDVNNSSCWVHNEILPEITLLDVTCDTPTVRTTNIHCDSPPTTPKQMDVNLHLKPLSTATPFQWLWDEILPETTLLNDTYDTPLHLTRNASVRSGSVPGTPTCKTEMPKPVQILGLNPNSNLNFTLTPKTDSPRSEQEPPSLETTHDCSPNKRPSSEMSEIILEKSSKSEMDRSSKETLSSTFTGNLTHSIDLCSEISDSLIVEDVKNSQLQETRDISTSSVSKSSKTSPVDCGKSWDKMQIAADCTLASQTVTITCDLSSSREMSVQCHGSQSLASNSINVTSEPQVEPVETTSPEEELRHNSGLKVTKQSTAGSLNNTFTAVQLSELSTASNQVLNPQSRTIDLSTSNNGSDILTETQQADLSAKSSTESCDMKNHTFEKNSLQKSSGNTLLEESGATKIQLHNTFETKPSGTINNTETSSSDKCKNLTEMTSPSPVNNATTTEACPLQVSGNDKIQASTDHKSKTADTHESTSDVNPAVEENFGASASSGEAKDSLNGGHTFSESLNHQNVFTEHYKADTFNLDSTLEFKLDSQFTSTPMSTSKPFTFTSEREVGKTTAAQKKLYGGGPCKPVQGNTEMPSNIVCDRKTFLRQPATKSFLPTIKAQLLLTKFKPESTLPKCSALFTSGRPLTRQTEALKMNATADAVKQTTEITGSHNLRSATAALKQPASFRKPALSGIPSGIHRPVHAAKPTVPKNTATGSDKPAGATTAKATKHPLTKFEALPPAKKKKTDVPLPSSNIEAPIFSSGTASKGKPLKHPTTSQRTLPTKCKKNDAAVQSTSTENITTYEATSRIRALKLPATGLKAPTTNTVCQCYVTISALEEQLKLKDDEIRKLKEELLKSNK